MQLIDMDDCLRCIQKIKGRLPSSDLLTLYSYLEPIPSYSPRLTWLLVESCNSRHYMTSHTWNDVTKRFSVYDFLLKSSICFTSVVHCSYVLGIFSAVNYSGFWSSAVIGVCQTESKAIV